jgi:hypothetical protein
MLYNATPFATLAEAQAAAKVAIDNAAGATRARYITVVPGQSETYAQKAADAAAYQAAGYPADTTQYPWVSAESVATGSTPTIAADTIIAMRNAWVGLGAAIEKERIVGKRNIEAATTVAEVMRARDTALSTLRAM